MEHFKQISIKVIKKKHLKFDKQIFKNKGSEKTYF